MVFKRKGRIKKPLQRAAIDGRNGWIRTTDLCDPNAAFYQAELRSDVQRQYIYTKKNKITSFF